MLGLGLRLGVGGAGRTNRSLGLGGLISFWDVGMCGGLTDLVVH